MDVAALALNVDSSKVLKAANDLDTFAAAATRAGAATGNPNGSIAKLVATVQSMNAKLAVVVGSLDKISAAMGSMSRASQGASTGLGKVANDAGKAGRAFVNADAHVMAYAEHLRKLSSIPVPPIPVPPRTTLPTAPQAAGRTSSAPYYGAAAIQAIGQAAQFSAHHAQNLFFQLNDIFVGAMSGQKPLTILMQQGSQIGQIYQQAGLSLKGFTLGLIGMLGIIKTTTAATEAAALAAAQQATASVAGANASAVANVRAAETNILIARTQASMAVTATEAAAAEARLAIAVDALAVSQAEAAITGRALATSQGELAAASNAAGNATKTSLTGVGVAVLAVVAILALVTAGLAALTSQANDDSGLKKYTTAMGYTKAEVLKLNAVTVTFGDTLKAVFQVGWERIAAMFGITTDELAKKWASFTDWLVTATRASIAGIYAAFTGLQNVIPRILDNIKTGRKENLFEIVGGSFADQYREAQAFMDDVVKQAGKNARDRQDAMAKGMYDKPSAGAHKYDFSDILKDADKIRNDLIKTGMQIGLYGEALARVTYEQDLLNKASEHGLELSPSQRSAISSIAAELAKLAEANRLATFREETKQAALQQFQALKDAAAQIGVYGRELAALRYEQEMLNKATAAHITLTENDMAVIRSAAEALADKEYANTRALSAADNSKAHNEAMRQLDVERGALGLTGEALISYNYQQELINKALQAGVAFKDLDIERTRRQGDAYAAARYAIDQQAQAIADAREVTKGFFTDWINGVREGGNLFKTFANSVINSLNRIIDKLLDKALNGFLDSLFGGGPGGGSVSSLIGSLFANGGAFGTPQRFANGGAFSNSVITTPTLFRFANGAALGEMGEAGPEAVMPLKRGANGALGVAAHGGGSAKNVEANVTNNYQFAGAIGIDGIVSMIRQGGEATYAEVRRNLESMLQQLNIDGAVV